ncbi:flagella synthesis protein FlgN [Vreelandella boliviensis]|uniref:Flagella synthesis protein flgN n=1 Tax=Vreelandella boliviensis LC1 TaxID=1072583 RepID=A0A265DYL6_9GAMM|nr:flagellar protein FlgN [Halomonas boliviensis]EHJ94177.1 Flagella synthesis protein flgN [Halomonas boliviensis LC1]OZT74434.1 flagellar protein FlgN [Halomonas boliviensis LC1]
MSLASLLTNQQQRLDALISLLSNEQNLLTQGDIDGDALSQVALDKQSLLAELERIETLRRNVQERLGYAEGANGAREAAQDAGCQTAWESLLEKSERASRMNELTGQMLSVRMKHNQAMLDYIRQIAEKTLYKPDGRNSAQPGRINASA